MSYNKTVSTATTTMVSVAHTRMSSTTSNDIKQPMDSPTSPNIMNWLNSILTSALATVISESGPISVSSAAIEAPPSQYMVPSHLSTSLPKSSSSETTCVSSAAVEAPSQYMVLSHLSTSLPKSSPSEITCVSSAAVDAPTSQNMVSSQSTSLPKSSPSEITCLSSAAVEAPTSQNMVPSHLSTSLPKLSPSEITCVSSAAFFAPTSQNTSEIPLPKSSPSTSSTVAEALTPTSSPMLVPVSSLAFGDLSPQSNEELTSSVPSTSSDESYFSTFLNDILKYSPSSPTLNNSPVNTDSLQKPESSHGCDIDSNVLKFLLDQTIDKCNKLAILYAELNTKLETETERKTSETREDNDTPVENLVTSCGNSCSCTNSSQKLSDLEEKLFDLDCRVIECKQYPRRENIVVSGIPDNVTHADLKNKAVLICNEIGLEITEYDIAACHRLPKKQNSRWPANTIIRFYSRDHVEYCLTNRDKVKSQYFRNEVKMNIRIFENLATKNAESVRIAKWMQDNGIIHNYFIRNGYVKIIIDEDDEPIRIKHPDIIRRKFSEFEIQIP